MPIPGFHAIVPAGGAGTRLWPLSRAGRPKFLLDLTGSGRSLLQATVDRLTPIVGPEGVVVVTGARHAEGVARQVAGLDERPGGRLLVEPSPRDSMAAIGLAAAVLLNRHGDEVVVGSFAADHVVVGHDLFEAAVAEAVEAARAGFVATIGIRATGPSTAFGYIHEAGPLGVPSAPTARHVAGFAEKPDEETARAYLATGEYRWNAGMFVVRARVLLDHLAQQLPGLADGLVRIAAAWDTPRRAELLDAVWPTLTRIAIDHAIAEPVAAAGGVAVVPGEFGWDDVGDFASLAELVPDGALGAGDDVLRIGSPDAFVVPAGGRAVTVVGIPGAVVVETPDALLVTTRSQAQHVKAAVDAWRDARPDLV